MSLAEDYLASSEAQEGLLHGSKGRQYVAAAIVKAFVAGLRSRNKKDRPVPVVGAGVGAELPVVETGHTVEVVTQE